MAHYWLLSTGQNRSRASGILSVAPYMNRYRYVDLPFWEPIGARFVKAVVYLVVHQMLSKSEGTRRARLSTFRTLFRGARRSYRIRISFSQQQALLK